MKFCLEQFSLHFRFKAANTQIVAMRPFFCLKSAKPEFAFWKLNLSGFLFLMA